VGKLEEGTDTQRRKRAGRNFILDMYDYEDEMKMQYISRAIFYLSMATLVLRLNRNRITLMSFLKVLS